MKQLLAWRGSADSTITSEAVMAMAEKFNTGQEVCLQIPSARGVMQVKEGTSGSIALCVSGLTVEVQRFRTSGEQRQCGNSLAISTLQYVKKRMCHSYHSLDTITSPVAKLIRTLVPVGRASLATTNGAASSETTISPCNSNVLLFRGTPRTKIV
jgi:hypothetical protein